MSDFKPTCGKCGNQSAADAIYCETCGTGLYALQERKRREARRELDETVHDRQYGCIVSFENAQGQTLVLHRGGARKGQAIAGLAEACETALALDPSFRVVAYSTPQTILSDLRGRADRYTNHERPWGKRSPESIALGHLRRPELLHPRLR